MLRTGKVGSSKLTPQELEELIVEAEFYQIQGLIKLLKPQKSTVSKFDPGSHRARCNAAKQK